MRCIDSSTVALMLRSLNVSEAAVRTPMPSTPADTAASSPFGVRHQPEQRQPFFALDTSQHIRPVGHLGHRLGAHEGHRVEIAEPGRRQDR